MARFSPGCSGWMIYCPKLDAYWQWKTVWRFPSADGGFKEQPEVRETKDDIETAFLETHWWGKDDPEKPQFDWYPVAAPDAEAHRVAKLRVLVTETPLEIAELDSIGATDHADVLRSRLEWYRNELRVFVQSP